MSQRRSFLKQSLAGYASLCLGCNHAWAQLPPPGRSTRNPSPTKRAYTGCSLRSASDASQALGSNGLGTSTGIPQLDTGLNNELQFLKSYFGVNPGVFTVNENNAFATPHRLQNHAYPDGTVVLGRALIQDLFNKFKGTSQISMGDHALVGVLAHEFAHICFFKSGVPMPQGKQPELHADFMAGWYTGIRAMQLPGKVNLQETAKQMFDIGDFSFNSPQHHGTPQERLRAYMAGLNLTVQSNAQTNLATAFQRGLTHVGLA